ncbi:MAG: hypothetical protein JWN78_3333 [Bacteroidota bacterium]|nr:hypothetical protein [Bacteroidota bacterium]
MFILVSPFFVRYFTPRNISGIALFPFIIVSEKKLKDDATFIMHEKIHIRQQAELLVIFFFLVYVTEFFILLLKYKDTGLAYRNISFEKEAYENESNYNYLKTRKLFSFIKYW